MLETLPPSTKTRTEVLRDQAMLALGINSPAKFHFRHYLPGTHAVESVNVGAPGVNVWRDEATVFADWTEGAPWWGATSAVAASGAWLLPPKLTGSSANPCIYLPRVHGLYVSFRARLNTAAIAAGDFYGIGFRSFGGAAQSYVGFLGDVSTTKIAFRDLTNGNVISSGANFAVTAVTYDIGLMIDATGNVTLYQDGVSVGTGAVGTPTGSVYSVGPVAISGGTGRTIYVHDFSVGIKIP